MKSTTVLWGPFSDAHRPGWYAVAGSTRRLPEPPLPLFNAGIVHHLHVPVGAYQGLGRRSLNVEQPWAVSLGVSLHGILEGILAWYPWGYPCSVFLGGILGVLLGYPWAVFSKYPWSSPWGYTWMVCLRGTFGLSLEYP